MRGSKNHYNLAPCSEENMPRGIAEQTLFSGPGYELEKGGKDSLVRRVRIRKREFRRERPATGHCLNRLSLAPDSTMG